MKAHALLVLLFLPSISLSDELTVHENRIGTLQMSYGMSINEEILEESFPSYQVEKIEWKQEGFDTIGYTIKSGDLTLLAFKAAAENHKLLEEVLVSSLSDSYGISIGSKYSDIKAARPDLIYETDYHLHTYAGTPTSNIAYLIEGDVEPRDGEIGERTSFEESEILNWEVTSIIWRQPPNKKLQPTADAPAE